MPMFSWSMVANAARYDLWVNDLTTGQMQVIRQQNLTTNTYTPTAALTPGTYVFWVQAFSAAGSGSGWGTPLTFTVT